MFRKTKNPKSFFVLIITFFWVSYICITLTQAYFNITSTLNEYDETKKSQVDFVFNSGTNDLVKENFDELRAKLDKAYDLHLIHFYILQKNGDVVFFKTANDELDSVNFDYKNFNTFIDTQSVSFKTIKVFDYRLTAGFNKSGLSTTLGNLWEFKYLYLNDLIIVTLMLMTILWVVLKDIMSLTKVLSQKDRDLSQVQANTKEAAILLKASQSFESKNTQLERENDHFSGALSPAIVTEIRSGRKAPYSFDSTLVRVDLNGYTQIFLKKNSEYVTSMMNIYFQRAREVIERYDGLIYQYVGDEIVFHFKGEHHESVQKALSCIRSLFEIADDLERSLPEGAGHCFKIKSSFVFDNLRFTQLDSGYSLSGLALIESNRLLNQIEDKTKNTVAFLESEIPHVKKLCNVGSVQETQLKGFSHTSKIAKAWDFTNIENVKQSSRWPALTYYRSDRDLIFMLNWMSECVRTKKYENFFLLFHHLKSFKVKAISRDVFVSYLALLTDCKNQGVQNTDSQKVYASAISLCAHIIPTAHASEELLKVLHDALAQNEPRVQANTIIVLDSYVQDFAFLNKFMDSPHNRLAADALYVAGKKNLNHDVVKRLKDYYESDQPLFRASARWVIYQLLNYYEQTDPVFYNTNPLLHKLKNLVAQETKAAA